MYNECMEKSPKRKAGRPPGSRNRERKDGVRANLYLDRQAFADLWALAKARGESRNQTVEAMVADWMARRAG